MKKKLNLAIALNLLLLPLQSQSQQLKTHYQASPKAYQMLRQFEGYYPFTYRDAAGYKTIAFGHKLEKGDKIEEPCLGACADDLLESDVKKKVRPLNAGLLRDGLNATQFDSALDFSYNLGIGAFSKSSLRTAINARHPKEVVQAWFIQYKYAGGRELAGLLRRRKAEAALWGE